MNGKVGIAVTVSLVSGIVVATILNYYLWLPHLVKVEDSIQGLSGDVDSSIQGLSADVQSLSGDIRVLSDDVKNLSDEINSTRQTIADLNEELSGLKDEVNELRDVSQILLELINTLKPTPTPSPSPTPTPIPQGEIAIQAADLLDDVAGDVVTVYVKNVGVVDLNVTDLFVQLTVYGPLEHVVLDPTTDCTPTGCVMEPGETLEISVILATTGSIVSGRDSTVRVVCADGTSDARIFRAHD